MAAVAGFRICRNRNPVLRTETESETDMLCVFRISANIGAEAARAKFTEHKEKLEKELDTQLRLSEKLESELSAKRELCNTYRLGMNSQCQQ